MVHDDACCKFRDAVQDMAEQFAHRCTNGSRRWLTAGGLSALEHAFEVLAWDDPHYVEDGGCEIVGCEAWSTCVGAYPRSLARPREAEMAGFGYLCGEHYRKWNGPNAEGAPDVGRIQ